MGEEVFLDDLRRYAFQLQVTAMLQEISIDDDFILISLFSKAALGVIKVFGSVSGLYCFKQIFTCRGEAPLRLVQYLRTHVPDRCLIEIPE
jgi:hypothetical protein